MIGDDFEEIDFGSATEQIGQHRPTEPKAAAEIWGLEDPGVGVGDHVGWGKELREDQSPPPQPPQPPPPQLEPPEEQPEPLLEELEVLPQEEQPDPVPPSAKVWGAAALAKALEQWA